MELKSRLERAMILFKPLKQLPDKYHTVDGNASLARRGCGTPGQQECIKGAQGSGEWRGGGLGAGKMLYGDNHSSIFSIFHNL
jgi:hypothetical protein